METALGNEPADLVIRNGRLVDVYSGRVVDGRSVAVKEKWIAYVGPDAGHAIGAGTNVIEADGRLISPGYMDTHTHLCNYWNMADFLFHALPGGTTTFITELETAGYSLGAEGVEAFLAQMRNRPAKFYCMVPPMVTLSPALRSLYVTPAQLKRLLKDPIVLGIGESYWQGVVLTSDDRVLELMQQTLHAGKSVQGHAAGAFDRKLAAYAAAGALSCHESITPEDVLSRLELGYYVMVREGDIRRDLDILLPIKDQVDFKRLILITDGTNPDLLLKRGYLVDVLQKAVDIGIDPVKTIQMVSINPAVHFGLDHILGGIAPNRFADILLLPEEGKMRPDVVISEGRVVAEMGNTVIDIPRTPYPAHFFETVKVDPLSTSDLAIPSSDGALLSGVRSIDIQPGGLVTREGRAMPAVVGGRLEPNPEEDLLKVVFIERITGKGERFVGFLRGWGQKEGASATTLCWEAGGIVAVGSNDLDLTVAINRVIEMQGGSVVSANGKVRLEIPYNVLGFLSELPISEIAARADRFQKEVNGLGSKLEYPHLSMMVLTTSAIPFIRITEKGYYRFRENDLVGID